MVTSKLRSPCQEGAKGMKFHGKNIPSKGSRQGGKVLEEKDGQSVGEKGICLCRRNHWGQDYASQGRCLDFILSGIYSEVGRDWVALSKEMICFHLHLRKK